MRKTISIATLVILCLGLLFTQAFAYSPTSSAAPKHTPQPNETEAPAASTAETGRQGKPDDKGKKADKANPHAGKKYVFKGEVTSYAGGVLGVTVKDGTTVEVTVDANTEIKTPGAKNSATDLQPQARVIVQAVMPDSQSYLALRVIVMPTKPQRVHRVGEVTAYDPGKSITIKDKDGTSTFQIAPDAKILPTERIASLKVGARVTIISPRDPSGETLIAKGIVVHPEK